MRSADPLSRERAALVGVSAAIGARDPRVLRTALVAAAQRASHGAIDEVLLQAHLFVGYPDALNAMALWREIAPAESPVVDGAEPAEWTARGEQVCATVYGRNYQALRANVSRLHPELDRWMVRDGYGRVLGRGGLDLATRELCVAALLAVWGAPRQLHSHLRGALNAGATAAEVDAAVAIACERLEPAAGHAVGELWAALRGRR